MTLGFPTAAYRNAAPPLRDDGLHRDLFHRAKGFSHVETGAIRDSVHYVAGDQPDAIADLIELHASRQ